MTLRSISLPSLEGQAATHVSILQLARALSGFMKKSTPGSRQCSLVIKGASLFLRELRGTQSLTLDDKACGTEGGLSLLSMGLCPEASDLLL